MRGSSISRPPMSEPPVFIQAGGLHGDRQDLQVRVELLGLPQQRQDLRLVVGDAEVRQAVVGLAGRQVVVGVRGGGGEVGGADRLPQVVEAVTARRGRTARSWRRRGPAAPACRAPTADESVMAAPNPDMVWKVRPGSTTTVGAVVGASLNATVPRSAILSVPSGVVIHTWAETAGDGGGAADAVLRLGMTRRRLSPQPWPAAVFRVRIRDSP